MTEDTQEPGGTGEPVEPLGPGEPPGAGEPPQPVEPQPVELPGPPRPPKPSKLAVTALVLSVAGVLCLIPAVAGLVLGLIEMNRIKTGRSSDRGYTTVRWAIIVGIVAVAINILSTAYLISTGGISIETSSG